MKKSAILAAAGLLLASGLAFGQRLRAGEQAIFLKNGDTVIGAIVDINSERLVLELKDGTNIPLRDIWMVNFVNDQWNFPQERNLIETNEHYVFLKSGDVSSGRIVDFSGEPRNFEFATGEKYPIGAVRRIYFAKAVPRGLR